MSSIVFTNNKQAVLSGMVEVPRSKSVANRYLVLDFLCAFNRFEKPEDNWSNDIRDMWYALEAIKKEDALIDIGESGTALRFLCGVLSLQNGKTFELSGRGRIPERPLKPLLTALEQLGGRFHYLNTPYFAPLKIEGRKLVSSTIQVTSNESSQYASSLLLIASFIEGGLRLQFDKTIKSLSYLNLTIDTLRQFGAIIYEEENCIQVEQKKLSPPLNLWPADWSSAPYFLALAACSNEANIFIQNIDKDPSQADFAAIEIFTRYFNIDCHFEKDGLRVQKKSSNLNQEEIQLNGSNFPDLVPTLFSCAAVLGRKISIEGIGHLRFKESDRIEVLKTELKKVGFEINQSQEDCWQGIPSEVTQTKTLEFSAHHDHRMAMSFSLFSLKFNNVRISGAESINKSFPTYWKTLSNLGFQFEIT